MRGMNISPLPFHRSRELPLTPAKVSPPFTLKLAGASSGIGLLA